MRALQRFGRQAAWTSGLLSFRFLHVLRSTLGSCISVVALLATGCFCVLTASCAVDVTAIRNQNASLVLTAYRARPLTGLTHGRTALTLPDCVKLSLENSLELQAAMWEEQVRRGIAKSSLVRMLPRIEGTFNQTQRDRTAFSRSDVINEEGAYEVVGPGPGTGVTNFSTARERGQRDWNVQLKWSPMDACMARYLSNVRENDRSHAAYQKVRVAQQLVGTATVAFYRLLALQEALPKAQALESNRRAIAQDIASLADQSLVDKQELIIARSLLAEAQNQLSDIYVGISKQRALLAATMNASPDSCFTVVGNLRPLPRAILDACKLEAVALVNRPEAYQADIDHLSSLSDQKRLIVRLLPRAEGFIGHFRDENKFIYNRNWTDGGLRVTWDLMDFTATLLEERAARDKVLKTNRDRALISVGILTQVRMRVLEAISALERHTKMSRLLDQAREALRIATEVEEAKQRGAPRSVILIARQKALCAVLQTEIDQIAALGEAHAAFADLDAAVGSTYPVSRAHPVSERGFLDRIPRPQDAIGRALHSVVGTVNRLVR